VSHFWREWQLSLVRSHKGHKAYIWNNTGDKAYLRNPSGAQQDYCAWTDPRTIHSTKTC
jgi:hypothetical protein